MTALVIALGLVATFLAALLLRDRRQSKERIMDLEAARKICDLGNDPVLVADIVEGRILHANPTACALLGVTLSELVSKTLPSIHPPELVSKSAEAIADVWDKKGLVYSDMPFVRKDGERIDVEISATIIDYRGKAAILIYARDIRERRKSEQKIREYSESLEATNRQLREAQAQLVMSEKMASLGNLVAGVAHELNTPLGAISANADTGRRAMAVVEKALSEPAVASLLAGNDRLSRAMKVLEDTTSVVANASTRATGIVTSLRNFARLDEAERKRANLHEGIDSTLSLIGFQLKGRITVERSYGEIPDLDCFPSRLNQVFMNILVNAAQAIEGTGTIGIRTMLDAQQIVIEISDTGKGIQPDHLQRIFDPGFTTKGVGVGTGLGLSIAYRIVKDHRGTITVTSEVGKGTAMTIRLPVD